MRIPAVLDDPRLVDLHGAPAAAGRVGGVVGATRLAGTPVDVAPGFAEGDPVHHLKLGVGPADCSSDVHNVRALGDKGQRWERGCGCWRNGGRCGGRRRGRCGACGCGSCGWCDRLLGMGG